MARSFKAYKSNTQQGVIGEGSLDSANAQEPERT